MLNKELKNKPLVEAILELKWKLPNESAAGIASDPRYRLLLGRFSEKVQQEYPAYEPLPTASIPDEMAAHMVQHRFRTKEGGWPLIQLGPGILTFNETSGYKWTDFHDRCISIIKLFVEAYPNREMLNIKDLVLRYIDAVDFDYKNENAFDFLKDMMQTTICLPDSLFSNGNVLRNPLSLNLQTSFIPSNPKGIITLRLATGHHHNKPSLIWETIMQSSERDVPRIPEEFENWIDKV